MKLDMDLNISVLDKSFKGTIRDVLTINEASLSNEFVEQPSVYAWFAALSEMASAEVESRKMSLSILKANLDSEKRSELNVLRSKDSSLKVTESMVESAILKDNKYQAMQEALIEAERQLGVLKAMVKALEQRCTMLVQLGSMRRQEMSLSDFGINMDKVHKNNG